MAVERIHCAVCGALHPTTKPRCAACGARVELLSALEEKHAHPHRALKFEWKWAGISFAIYLLLGALVLVALPMALPSYDPQGFPGILIAGAVGLVAGFVVGLVSPAKTWLEPALGALFAIIPILIYLDTIDDIYPFSTMAYVVGVPLGAMSTFLGAFLGGKISPQKQSAA